MADDAGEHEDRKTSDANTMLLGGLGIGAFGLVSAAIGGAVCPVCVVAAPALLGIGAFKRWKEHRAREQAASPPPVPPPAPAVSTRERARSPVLQRTPTARVRETRGPTAA